MLFDGIRLVEGAELTFVSVPYGPVLPASTMVGELFFLDTPAPGSLQIYNGTAWQPCTYPYTPVNRAGDSMTGYLILHANPTDPMHAATKQYVDTHAVDETQVSRTVATLARLSVAETVSGAWTFSNPVSVGTPTANGHAATKLYVDSVAGSATTNLTYTAATRLLESSSGTDVTLPLFTSTDAGLTPLSGGGTTNFLRADGTWAAPGGSTDLSYTASTRVLASSTGADATLPLFTSTDAGLVPLSGGGTTNFLRADGTWASAAGTPGGSDTHVQYNNSGAFGGSSDFTWNNTTKNLNVLGTVLGYGWYLYRDSINGAIEGGQIVFQRPTGSALGADVTFDLYNNSIRIFTAGGQGAYITLNTLASGTYGSRILTDIDLSGFVGVTNLGYTASTRLLTSSTGTDVTLPLVSSADAGLAPATGGGTTNFLRADGTWASPPGGAPGGSDGAMQYNDGGSYGGAAQVAYDDVGNILNVGVTANGTIRPTLSATDVVGRTLTLQGGIGNGNANGGQIVIVGGTQGAGTYKAGDVTVQGGNSGFGNSLAGDLYLRGGNTSTATYAGSIFLRGGDSASGGNGGSVTISGGTCSHVGGTGGAMIIEGGTSANTGGQLTIRGGWSQGNPGASVTLSGGLGSGGTEADRGYVQSSDLHIFKTSNTTRASIRMPHGTAPTAPTNGDVWTTTAGMYVQVNGSTIGPLGPSTSTPAGGSDTHVQFNDGGVFGGDAGLTYNKTTNLLSINSGQLLVYGASSAYAIGVAFTAGANPVYLGSETGGAGFIMSNYTGGYIMKSTLVGSFTIGTNASPVDGPANWRSFAVGGVGCGIITNAQAGNPSDTYFTGNLLRAADTYWYNQNGSVGGVIQIDGAGSWNFQNGTGVTSLTTRFSITTAGVVTATARIDTAATTTSSAGLRLPHGTAPTSPVNGDVWTTTAGMYARINGGTVGPFGAGGTPAGADTQVQFNNAGAFGGDDDFTWNSTTRTLALGTVGGLATISIPNNLTFNGDTLYIDSTNSRVGLGTSTPEATLHVRSQGTGNTRGILLQHVDDTTAFSHAKYIGRRSRGSNGSPTAVLADDSLVGFISQGYKATGWSATTGGVYIYAAENWTDTATGTYVTIRGPAVGTTTVTERVRFEHLKTTFTGGIITAAGTTSLASVRMPHGVAPTSPVDGDVWTTTGGIYVRVNGTTVGPLGAAGAFVAPNYEEFVATAAQTVFNTTMTTTAKAAGKAYLQVFVNGVLQQEGATKKFTVTGANQITFNAGLALNDDVAVYGFA